MLRTKNQTPHPRDIAGGASKLSTRNERPYDSGRSLRLPAIMWTARDSRAVTDILVLDELAAFTGARQLASSRPTTDCCVDWSEIEAKDVVI